MDTQGIIYIAIGPKAEAETTKSIASLKRYNDLPITVISDYDNSRRAKVNLDRLSEYDRILYLDADTRIHGDVAAGFKLLDNWDLALAPSRYQDGTIFQHIKTGERLQTIRELGYLPIQLQAGVMYFHRQRCARLFEYWRQEWQRWQDQDQAALVRALAQCPIRVWLLSNEYNGGKLIEHLFGNCR